MATWFLRLAFPNCSSVNRLQPLRHLREDHLVGDMDFLLRSLELRDRLSDGEKALLRALPSRTVTLAAGATIIQDEATASHSCLLVDGFAARCHYIVDGRRQFSAIHLPGDFMDLHGFLLKRLDHGIVALTSCRVALVPHEKLQAISEGFPHLTRLLWLLTAIDAAVHRAWVVNMGRPSSVSHMAHFICELYTRLDAIGRVDEHSFRMPLTQSEVSDLLGLSVVHVNRTLQELRRLELLSWRDQLVKINNWHRLTRIADFDPSYLSLANVPR